jgi:hypothetical protein
MSVCGQAAYTTEPNSPHFYFHELLIPENVDQAGYPFVTSCTFYFTGFMYGFAFQAPVYAYVSRTDDTAHDQTSTLVWVEGEETSMIPELQAFTFDMYDPLAHFSYSIPTVGYYLTYMKGGAGDACCSEKGAGQITSLASTHEVFSVDPLIYDQMSEPGGFSIGSDGSTAVDDNSPPFPLWVSPAATDEMNASITVTSAYGVQSGFFPTTKATLP